MKKLIITILAGFISVLSAWAQVTSGSCGDNLQWSFNEQTATLTITGTGPMWDYNMESDSVPSPWYYFQSQVQNVVFHDGITSIGRGAFYGADSKYEASISSIHIPSSVTKIEWSAFRNCRRLHTVVLEEGLLTIGDAAFHSCTALNSVQIPSTVSDVDVFAFPDCKNIVIDGLEPFSIQSNSFSSKATILVDCSVVETFSNDLGWKKFQIKGRIDKFHIGESLDGEIEIGVSSCEDNTIEIYARPYYIKKYRFSHWSDGNTDNPRTLTVTRDTTITPYFVERDDTWCGENLQWSYDSETHAMVITGYGDMFDYEKRGDAPWYDIRENIQSISLPNGITSIGNYAFSGLSSIVSQIIPNGVTRIGDMAFDGCSYLKSTQLPNSLQSIEYYAFDGSGLNSITIPANVTHIDRSFAKCRDLESIVVDSNNKAYDSRDNCNAIIRTETNMLEAGCINTKIPNNVIGIAGEAFRGIPISSLAIPSSVETIVSAFRECRKFHFVTIEDRTKPLKGSNLFDTGGKEIKVLAKEPFEIDKNAFHTDDIIYIPCGSMEKYQAARYWKELDLREREMSYNVELPSTEWGTATIIETNCANHTITIKASVTNSKYRFVRWSDGATDNPRTLTLTQDTTITAIFEEIPYYTISVTCDEEKGSITLMNPSSGWWEDDNLHLQEGSEITLRAETRDEYKYVFFRWSDGVTDNPRTLTITQDTAITAIFDVIPYHTVILLGQRLSGNTYHERYGKQDFYNESYMSFSIRDGRYIYIQEDGTCGKRIGWSDGENTNRRKVTITSDTTIYSVFDPMFHIDITAGENGHLDNGDIHSVLYSCTSGSFDICASPDEGYFVTGWSDGYRYPCREVNYGYPYSDINLTAHFEPCRQATVLVGVASDSKSMGSVSGSGIYQTGNYITITATPKAGCHFVEWSDGMDGMTRSIYLVSDTTLFATFAQGEIGGKCGDNLYWTMSDSAGTLTITGSGDMNTQQYTTWCNDANLDITALELPDGITCISGYAFCGENNGRNRGYSLSKAIIPTSVIKMGDRAFQGCQKLSHFEYLGDSADAYSILSECHSLRYVKAPANALYYQYGEWYNAYPKLDTLIVTNGWLSTNYTDDIHVPAYADFSNASNTDMQSIRIAGDGVKTLVLPKGLTIIDKGALQDSRYLQTITIPAEVTEVGVSAFENCRSLQSVVFAGQKVKTIGDWAFYNCHELQSITIPEGVTEVGKSAFYGCSYLTEISLPSTVKSIEDNGFALCSKVRKISVWAMVPPTIDAKTFEGVDRATPLHIPIGTREKYANAPYWQEFFNVEETLPTSTSIRDTQVSDDSAPRKIVRDGMVLILRNGKTYTTTGIEVK